MKITDLLLKNVMIMDLKATRKEAAVDEMINSLADHNRISDSTIFKKGIMEREAQTSTGLGDGIAMPHAKNTAVNEATVLFARSSKGVDYEALDGQPTYLFFMIAAPEGANDTHLQALASLARLLVNPEFVASLRNARTPEEVQSMFELAEKERLDKEKEEANETPKEDSSRPFVIAVTACPTGIAHTYMAEDALKKKAAEMNIDIKVETNGTEGVKNRLTTNDIERAAGVIIAADKNVEMDRFNGKPVLQRPVSDGIRKPEELIEKASTKQAPIYHASNDTSSNDEANEKGSVLSKVYKDLMNGISHMLPFVVGGGIILALSFLVEPYFGDKSEIFIFLNSLGSNAFNFLIPILAGYIAMSIGDRPGLMPGMVGGFMAVQSNAGFLGGLAAGFIAGYSILLLRRVLKGIPKSLEGLKSILLYPVLSLLIIGLLMYFIIDPVFSTINEAMISFLENLGTGNAVLLGALLGGMMAIDMGGPFNKAAYTFSIGIFTDTGDGSLMAAVMAGGMIPPLAIALASTLFKNKFTDDERKSGLTNYVLGLSFITEGAIPFAAADPLRIITSSVIGAAIAGGLTQFWNISIPAPHGGIFAIGLSNHALLFLVALAIGMVVSALILGFWKKKIPTITK